MSSDRIAPWRKSRAAPAVATKLSAEAIARARAAARAAGRRYPNLIDNMNAARWQRETQAERPDHP